MILEGFDIQRLCCQLMDHILSQNPFKVSDEAKAKIGEIVAVTEGRLVKGGNEELNLMYMLMHIKD